MLKPFFRLWRFKTILAKIQKTLIPNWNNIELCRWLRLSLRWNQRWYVENWDRWTQRLTVRNSTALFFYYKQLEKVCKWKLNHNCPLLNPLKKINGHILTYLGCPLFYNDFWISILGYGQLDHIKSEKSWSRDCKDVFLGLQDPKKPK